MKKYSLNDSKLSLKAKLSKVCGILSLANFFIFMLFFTGIRGSVVGLSRDNIYALISLSLGFFFGMRNHKKLRVTVDDKEDFERSILYYRMYNGVTRLSFVTAKTNCYTEPGGMQVERTPERIESHARILLKKYPQYCEINTASKKKTFEIKLRDKCQKKK